MQAQTRPADEILIIDDMAGLPWQPGLTIWHAPWRLGLAAAFNCGISAANRDCVFLLGADDCLLPECLERCWAAYERAAGAAAYYAVGVQYSDGREDQYAPCGAAMVSRELWLTTGGFPPESAVGAPDAAFISILLAHAELPDPILVDDRQPLYWYRVHEASDTARRGPWQGVILETRNLLTRDWAPPAWGRMRP